MFESGIAAADATNKTTALTIESDFRLNNFFLKKAGSHTHTHILLLFLNAENAFEEKR
jgi:hypothetical protein